MAYGAQTAQSLFGHQWLLAQRHLSLAERARDPMWRVLFLLATSLVAHFAYHRWWAQTKSNVNVSRKSTPAVKATCDPETRSRGEGYFVTKTHDEQPMHGFARVLDQVQSKLPSTEPRQPLADQSSYKVTKETDLGSFGVALQTKVVTMMPAGGESAALVLSMFGRYAVYPLDYNMTSEKVTAALERLGIKIILTTSENVERLGTVSEGILLLVAKASADSSGEFQISAARTK